MKKIYRNRKTGFTLIEVMLAIAIMLLVSGLFVSLIIATHESYYTTYNYNDSTDYCQMYGKIIQDQILADRQDSSFASGATHTYYMDPTQCQFMYGTTPVVELPRVTNRDGSLKWIFAVSDVTFDSDTNMCNIEITVIDNYHNPGVVLYEYNFGFWVPNYEMTKPDGTRVGETITVARGTNHPIGTPGSGVVIDNYEIEVTKN